MLRKSRLIAGAVAFFFVACLVVTAQEPPKKDGDGKEQPKGQGKGKGRGGFGGGFGARAKPGTVLASAIQDQLKLTDDQKKEVADLQKLVDEKLAKIMTDDQKKKFKEIQDRPMGGFGGGFGRPGGGRPGGQGGFPPKKDN